jgi:hypothetical protein
VRFLRVLCLLTILAPTAALAMPCCDPGEDSDCCAPGGDCPIAPTGECILTAGSAPVVSVTAPSLDTPAVAATVAINPAPKATGTLAAAVPRFSPHVPIYIDLNTLRN